MSDRNAQSHFNAIETPDVKRSIFPLLFHNIGTCNAGSIIPFLAYSDVLPGDTFKCSTTAIIRMQTPLNPTMDGLVYDTYYFSVPHRLVWDHWKEFMGENKDSAWETSTEYTVPMITAPATTGITKGTIADYMKLPKGVTGIQYQALPFRAYCAIYDCWFRNQNLIAPVNYHTDDTTRAGSNTVTELGGLPFKAGKLADYFTTCLPAPQKALPGMTQGMTIPLGVDAPVRTNNSPVVNYVMPALTWGSNISANTIVPTGNDSLNLEPNTGRTMTINYSGTEATGVNYGIYPNNLTADLTQATAATINALRLAFQVQKLQELWSRGGTRYFEILKNEFGTSPNMSVLQYPEYLGGTRNGIELQEIVQTSTSGSTSTDQLGYTGGMSKTMGINEDFIKSFQEHCILIGLLVIRQDGHLYQQSLNKMWTREKKLDYYTPILAHLGEQPVYKRELCATGTATDSQIFGYQERWAEYKYGQESTSGEMSSSYAQSLDVWHYGDWYSSVPTLAQNWFEATPEYIDRTLAVTSSVADQFKFDIVTNIVATRPMPVYCTPGLIDHF